MSTRLVLALAVTVSLAFANAARAGYEFPLGGDTESCNDPNNVITGLDAPSGVFASSSNKSCRVLCTHTVKDCRQYVSDASTCRLALLADFLFYQKHGCTEFQTGDARKLCIASAVDYVTSQRTAIKVAREALWLQCDDWGLTCLGTCPP